MKKIVITTALFMAILGTAKAQNASLTPDTTRAYFSADGVIKADTVHNTLLYWDYDAFDEDNMDWCAAYDAATDRITATTDHETAVLIASGKVDIWNAEQFTLWFDESGRCTLKHDCHWLE